MKICMVAPEFPPNCTGMGYYTFSLSEKLTELGNDVTVITRGSWKKVKIESFNNIKVYRVRFLPLPPVHVKIHGYFLNKFFSNTLKKNDFDIIHYHSPLVPPINTNLSSIVTFHGCWKTEGKMYAKITDFYSLYVRIFNKFFVRDEMNSIKNTNKITTVSYKVANDLSIFYEADINEITVVRNGVDIHLFKPNHKINREEFSILYTGRLVYRKGLIDLVKSAEYVCNEYPGASFILTGNGALRPTLEKMVQDLGLENNCSFLGFIALDELIKHYQIDTIHVLPSYYEGLPTTVLEAMACGIPVVATDISGTNDAVVDGETGILVPPKNPKALADGIIKLLGDENLRKKMGKAGRERVEREFSWDTVAGKIVKLYEDVLAGDRE